MGKPRKKARPRIEMRLVTTVHRDIVLSGGTAAMAWLWREGIKDGLSYNPDQGNMLAAYLAAELGCTQDEAWAAMMTWAERDAEE